MELEKIFYQVEKGNVHISGEILFNDGNGRYELIEYTFCEVPIRNLSWDSIMDAEEQCQQYYRYLEESEVEEIAESYFDGSAGKLLQLSDVNKKTEAGCYFSLGW
ncbi:MAG: hypothetical protein IJI66_13910 [Erysipelotrichaceae bacterium]|nr:hypothetical protein [Erysipelotrichaceae bacterium]